MSSIEPDLLNLIVKYNLSKFIQKFENEGIKSYEDVKYINKDSLRSYYHMLEVDLRNFENLRSECIKSFQKSNDNILTNHNPLDSPRRTTVGIPNISSPAYDNSRSSHESMPRLVGDASNSIQDGVYLLDYHTDKAVGEFKMKGSTPCIQTFPDQVIIQNEALLCDFHSQNPVCELKVKDRTPYVLQMTNIESVDINRSQENLESARPDIPLYDRALVDGHKGLGIIIAYNHMENMENRNAISNAFKMLFQKMNLHIVYANNRTEANLTTTLKSEISEAVKVSMKIFFIGIFSYRQDKDSAKVQLQNGNVIGLNEIFQILKENIPIEIPKVIIIQACQAGLDTEMGAEYRLDMNKPYNASIMESNYLVVYSNVGALKDPEQSLWYIHSLIKAYNELQDRSDFYHVLVRANQLMLMGKSSPDAHKKPAQIESTLSRHLYV